jgi:hypothetical protein
MRRVPQRHVCRCEERAGSKGAVRDRSQTYNGKIARWTKRDAETGQFMDQKQDGKPFKGVRKEK